MSYTRFKRQRDVSAIAVGMNAAVTANGSAVTGNAIDVTGANEIAFYVAFTRSASTVMTWSLEVSYKDNPGSSDWYLQQSEAITSGAGALSDYTPVKTSTATENYVVKFTGLNARCARLKATSTNGNTDTVTVNALVAYTQG